MIPHPFAVAALLVVLGDMPAVGQAQQEDREMARRLEELESKVERLDRKLEDVEEAASLAFFVLFLFGTVLAMWAQRHGQNGCLWFILGFIPCVNIIAALAALAKGADSEGRKG